MKMFWNIKQNQKNLSSKIILDNIRDKKTPTMFIKWNERTNVRKLFNPGNPVAPNTIQRNKVDMYDLYFIYEIFKYTLGH